MDEVHALDRLTVELVGWFGAHGAQALLARAVTRARSESDALADVGVTAAPSAGLTGLTESAASHAPAAPSAGVALVRARLVELLGRLLGDDLARIMVEQSMRSRPSDAPHHRTTEEATDG